MNNEKINELKSLDEYFPKGDKRRGEALVLAVEAFSLGKESDQEDLQEAYVIAMGEINNLRCKLGYNKEELISPSSQLNDDKELADVFQSKSALTETFIYKHIYL